MVTGCSGEVCLRHMSFSEIPCCGLVGLLVPWFVRRVLVPVLAVVVLAGGVVFSVSVSEHFAAVVPGFGSSHVAEGQSGGVCVWYTESPHRELARRSRVGNSCPSAPVVPHATTTAVCANGGVWRYAGSNGVGWWYVSVCAPAAPTGLACAATATTIEFSWTAVGSPSRYQVSKDNGATWESPVPIASTWHTFTGAGGGQVVFVERAGRQHCWGDYGVGFFGGQELRHRLAASAVGGADGSGVCGHGVFD